MVVRFCFPKKARVWLRGNKGLLTIAILLGYAILYYLSLIILEYQKPAAFIPVAHRIVKLSNKDPLLDPIIGLDNEDYRGFPNVK